MEDKNIRYLQGFFYADGCLHSKTKKHKHSLSVTISQKDQYIIEEFQKTFGGHAYSVKNSEKEYYRWYLSSSDTYKDFEKMGLTPRKTLTLKMPKLSSYKDFIRGYFDGDGSIYKSGYGTIKVEVLGTKVFLERMIEIFKKEIDESMQTKIYNGNGNVFKIQLNQTQSLLLYR